MPLVNALPASVFPGFQWSSVCPQQTLELITTYNLDELETLSEAQPAEIAWAKVGTMTSVGMGIVKVPRRVPQTLDYQRFRPDGNRVYHSIEVVAPQIKVNPFDLNFGYPMVWDSVGNGWMLKSESSDGTMLDFVGISGMASDFVTAGQSYGAQLVASLFYSGLYSTALSLTTPSALTIPQPNNPNGIALFTNGLGAEGTLNAQHYANPTMSSSGRFKNLYEAYGSFASKFGASLVVMGQKPHPTLSNRTSGARVTDVFGPTYMRDRFWQMQIQSLSPQLFAASGGVLGGVASTNPYSTEALGRMTEENFIGGGFGPQRFWIVPELDNHPYVTANPTNGPNGGPADFWINVSAGPKRAAWALLAGNSKDFVPTFNFYGPGDPRAMGERRCRFESDLDAGVSVGNGYGEIDMFFGV